MANKSRPTIELSGPGLSLKREITDDMAREVLLLVLGGGRTPQGGNSPSPHTGHRQPPAGGVTTPHAKIVVSDKTTIRDLMDQSQAKRSPEKITCIAFHIKHVQKAAEFSAAMLMKGFSNAGEPVPGNLSRDIAWTKKHGWITPVLGKSRSYVITDSGEKALRACFPPDTQRSLSRPKKKSKR